MFRKGRPLLPGLHFGLHFGVMLGARRATILVFESLFYTTVVPHRKYDFQRGMAGGGVGRAAVSRSPPPVSTTLAAHGQDIRS